MRIENTNSGRLHGKYTLIQDNPPTDFVSSALKKSLYFPLAIYLLSFYALKHRIRVSLFERVEVASPGSWKEMRSVLPSWVGTGGTFKNIDTGEITVYDPRRRAFPRRAYRQPALIRTRKYLAAYNTSPGTCDAFWGHSGRPVRTEFRFRPVIYRNSFVFFAAYTAWKGFWNILDYNVPNVYEEILKHPKTITVEDIERILRLVKFWQGFALSSSGFLVIVIVFASGCIGSMLVLFFRTVWRHVPQEDKDRIARDIQEREQMRRAGQGQGQTRREGQIRLE
jgi:hypothetical protein